MKLLMISGDRSMLEGKQGAFWHTLEAFSKEWERIDVICPRTESSCENRVATQSRNSHLETRSFFGNIHFHPSPHGLLRQSRWILEMGKKLINAYHHDVMTVHEYPPFYNGIGAYRLARAMKIPYALEVHHIVGYPTAADWKERIGKWMSWFYLPWAIKRATATRTVGKTTAEVLMKWGAPERKLNVVPSFYLDRALFESLGAPPPVHYDVVFCGRLVANKGADNLFRAIAKTQPASTVGGPASLLVIGDGPERKKLEALAKELKINHRVEFRGWLPTQKDVLQAIRSAKVLVMNSLSEGGPRVPLEAMAIGMPVIVTKVGVMPDVIVDGKNGLFTNGHPEDLAAKIERVLGDEQWRQQMGTEAKRIVERFERSILVAQYARFLRTCATQAASIAS